MRTLMLLGLAMALYGADYEACVAQLADDPSIRALEHEQHAVRSRGDAGGALADTQLVFGVENLPVETPAFDRYLPTSKVIGFNQKFNLGRDEALRSARSEERRFEWMRAYTLAQLKSAFDTALLQQRYQKRRLSLYQKEREVLETLYLQRQGVLSSGRDSSVELALIRERQLEVQSSEIDARSELERAQSMLVRLVGEAPQLDPPEALLRSWEPLELYPLLMAQSETVTAREQHALAEAQNGVDFTLQFLYKQREAGATYDGEDWVTLRGVVNLPLWGRSEAMEAGALEHEHGAAANYELLSRQWRQQMEALEARIEGLRQRADLQRKRLDAIATTFEAQQRSFESGSLSEEKLLETRIRGLKNELALLELEFETSRLIYEHNRYIKE